MIKRWPKVIAVEMEGAGVGAAIEQAHALGHVIGFMMIRGISDLPRPPQAEEPQGTAERDNWKPYASATAAAFTVGLIAHGLPEPPRLSTSVPASAPKASQPPPKATINNQQVIDRFVELMQPDCEARVLRLQGEAKLGKTHFVKTIFPGIARGQYQARCAIVDLRAGQGLIDVLHDMCGQLGGEAAFPRFHEAYTASRQRPPAPALSLRTFVAKMRTQPDQESSEDARLRRDLLTEFTADLAYLRETLVVLFLDTIDDDARLWLVNTLLTRLMTPLHMRAVIGGRSISAASGGLATMCCEHALEPVTDEEAYFAYCRERGLDLPEQSIRQKIHDCGYLPGLFVDSLGRKSLRTSISHV